MKFKNIFIAVFIFIGTISAQTPINNSGGPLMPEQAAYNVKFYDIGIVVNPTDSMIIGDVSVFLKYCHRWNVLLLILILSIKSFQLKRKIPMGKMCPLNLKGKSGKYGFI